MSQRRRETTPRGPRAEARDTVRHRRGDLPDRKEDRLLAAARLEFVEWGFQAANIHRICERAGVSIGAFYERFKGKAELLLALVEPPLDAFVAALTKARGARAALHAVIEPFVAESELARLRSALLEGLSSDLALRRASVRLWKAQVAALTDAIAAVRRSERITEALFSPSEAGWLVLAVLREGVVAPRMDRDVATTLVGRLLDVAISGTMPAGARGSGRPVRPAGSGG